MTAGNPGPKILATGFGPFPGARENPTAALIRSLAEVPPEAFGARELRPVLLPTDYRRSWAALRRIYAGFAPDIVVHFGLAIKAEAIRVERFGRRRVNPGRLDVSGFAPRSGLARRSGPEALRSTFPVDHLVAALREAGFPTAVSEDAGAYVCNATLYRSLLTAGGGTLVGLVHVPPEGAGGYTRERLRAAAELVLRQLAAECPGLADAASERQAVYPS